MRRQRSEVVLLAKTFQFTFAINGLVSQGFTGSMNTARNGLISLQKQSRDLKSQMKELDVALYKNEIDFEGYAQKANKVKNQLKQLEIQQQKLKNIHDRYRLIRMANNHQLQN